jgi:hypothetical protein
MAGSDSGDGAVAGTEPAGSEMVLFPGAWHQIWSLDITQPGPGDGAAGIEVTARRRIQR